MNALGSLTFAGLTLCFLTAFPADEATTQEESLPFGNFSIGLNVSDIGTTKESFETLDFQPVHGDCEPNRVVMQS